MTYLLVGWLVSSILYRPDGSAPIVSASCLMDDGARPARLFCASRAFTTCFHSGLVGSPPFGYGLAADLRARSMDRVDFIAMWFDRLTTEGADVHYLNVAAQRKRRPVNDNIKRLRLELGYSQEALADILDRDKTTVSHWELGKHAPGTDLLPLVAATLRTTVDMLLAQYIPPPPGKRAS